MRVAVYSYRRHCRCRCRHYLSATFEESPEMISSFYKGNRRKRLYRRTDGKFTLDDKKKRRRRFIKSGYGPRTIQLSSRKTEDITISESKIDGTVYIVQIGLFHKDLSVFLGGRAVCIIWRMVELTTSVPTSVF